MTATRLACIVLLAVLVTPVNAQNPVQWSGDTRGSVRQAREQSLPLLFWVSGGDDDDEDDLEDAQEECFRDPAVVDLIHKRFVPVRVSRNSEVLDAAGELGLPTAHGLYCAVLTPDGRVLDQMGPGEVADPRAFAAHLRSASDAWCSDLFERELRPLLEDMRSPKPKARLAAQTVYRLGIRQADSALIGLLGRDDLTATERDRLYSALASLGTQACVSALLDKAGDETAPDKAAAAALLRASPAALEWLLPELPGEEGAVSTRQMAAYQSAMRICRRQGAKAPAWWEKASAADRAGEIGRLRERAQAVMEYAGPDA